MIRLPTLVGWGGLVGLALGVLPELRAAQSLDFKEVFELLRANVASLSEAELEQAAAMGLIRQLGPRVALAAEERAKPEPGATTAQFQATVLDDSFAYVRVGEIKPGLDRTFGEVYGRLRSTNRLQGLVLDLRFCGGRDFAAALALADRFYGSEQPLADLGDGQKQSTDKTNAVAVPVAVLVNQKTAGAAELLAGILRHTDIALLIGTNTAGQAGVLKEFTLKSGHRLRIAVAPFKVANGKELPLNGLEPDIGVQVHPEDELAWFEDAFKVVTKPGRLEGSAGGEIVATNRLPSRRVNEAELVRRTREGQVGGPDSATTTPRAAEPAPPVVNDPALARALDLLKGIAVVSRFRPS